MSNLAIDDRLGVNHTGESRVERRRSMRVLNGQRLCPVTLEQWNTFFQFGSEILLGLTFLFGAGAIWTSWRIGNQLNARVATAEQDSSAANERAERLELEAAQQRERAANAERELLQLQERLAPRSLSGEQSQRTRRHLLASELTSC